MTCFYCKGNMKPDTTTYMEDLGNCIVIIKNVPCNKCTQCGEVVYAASVMEKIDILLNKVQQIASKILIMDFDKAA